MRFNRSPADADLVRAVLQGHKQRFAELIDRYKNLVYSVILGRISHPDEADDLAQETFLKAYHRLDTLHDPRKFGSWLRRIAENRAHSFLRSRSVREENADAVLALPVDSPEQSYEKQEMQALIWQAISCLSEPNREIILLFYMEEYSREQIARFLDLPADTVKSRLRGAREKLKRALEENFDEEVREAVQQKKKGKEFTRKVMGALPLAMWTLPRPSVFWQRLGWGVQAGVTGLLGVVLIGVLSGWWPTRDVRTEPMREERMVRRVRLAGEEEYLRFLDRTRFPQVLEHTSSIFGTKELDGPARQGQIRALRRGWGGRLVWEFAGGDEGWKAHEGAYGGVSRSFLPAEVRDGVLRVSLGEFQEGRKPVVELISPEIGYEARLFDRIEVRARLVHDRPQPARFQLSWTTPLNRLFPGRDPSSMERLTEEEERRRMEGKGRIRSSRFVTWRAHEFPLGSEWQDLVIEDLDRPPPSTRRAEKVDRSPLHWQGSLVDMRLTLFLAGDINKEEIGPEQYPEALEIDRIVLRSGFGMPEHILDLPEEVPPEFSGQWLGAGRFYPLDQRGLEWPIAGDLDGDGDLDLVVSYLLHDRDGSTWQGWITAFNDGKGRFASGKAQVLEHAEKYSSIVYLDGADVDGDGLVDLVIGKRLHTLVLLNEGQGIFREAAVWQNEVFMGVGDVDGDGDADVATSLYRPENHDHPAQERRLRTTLHLNDGRGEFTRKDGPEERGWSPYALDDFDGDGRAELVGWWSSDENLDMRLRVCSGFSGDGWRDSVEIPFQQLPMVRKYYLWAGANYVGDLDGDGRWDLGRPMGLYVGVENTQELGMEIRRAGEAAEGIPWLPRKVHLRHEMLHQPRLITQVQDLNGDGLRDPIFTDMNYRRGLSLLVMRGRKGAWPVEEGRYWLPPNPKGWTCGDVDGDGDTDVVVVVEGVGKRGVFVLPNLREGAGDRVLRYPALTEK